VRYAARVADRLAREHVFARDHYRCLVCGTDKNLEWAHIITRNSRYLRWETSNAVTLCRKDHAYFTEHPAAFKAWIGATFGPRHWDGLLRRQAEAERRGDSVDIQAVIRGFNEHDLDAAELERYRSGAWLG
jgi:hypothetical protein